ncbi:NADPH-dependent FMN reductase [Bacillus cytotoxicus]|uniref:NADPH-dependent FMN reductase n=1 Tax=Bacillus cytotoxicus TaxID=580165 RepID=UPI00244A2FD7|nr:NAD(P)H-dependent oxidoreductase [Bacillus cytotoxicus]MDH2882652.1 NAD(P)H-dependent oxidoreductase [Bacillus cytotoxicus]
MILVISGSSRTFSNNRGLANYVVNNLNQKGQEVEFFDLSKNPLPIFTGNVTEYENANVSKLKEIANRANSFVICTPEYHNGMSGGLKNALDFLSKEQFLNKPVTILCAAGSGKGGVNALNNLRLVIRGLHGLVLPQQHICDSIFFDDCQNLIDEVSKEIINNMMIDLVNFV